MALQWKLALYQILSAGAGINHGGGEIFRFGVSMGWKDVSLGFR